MSYNPKEGLITLYQAENPPINQALTEELNKTGYGEFIIESELSSEITAEVTSALNPINLKINSISNSIGFNGIVQLPTLYIVGRDINFSGDCKFIAPDTGDLITINYIVGITQQTFQTIYYFYINYRPEAPTSSYYAASTTYDPTRLNMFVSEIVGPDQLELTYYSNQLDDRITAAEGNISTLQTDLLTAEDNITDLKTDLSTAEGNISTLQTNLSTSQTNISVLQASEEPHGFLDRISSAFEIAEGTISFRAIDPDIPLKIYFKGKEFILPYGFNVPNSLPPMGVVRYI